MWIEMWDAEIVGGGGGRRGFGNLMGEDLRRASHAQRNQLNEATSAWRGVEELIKIKI